MKTSRFVKLRACLLTIFLEQFFVFQEKKWKTCLIIKNCFLLSVLKNKNQSILREHLSCFKLFFLRVALKNKYTNIYND